jgi:ASC-1-like (ASCH) protein
MTEYKKYLSEPWFTLIKLGKKKVEGRLNKSSFAKMNKGDIIKFTNSDFNMFREFSVIILKKIVYNSFKEYLESETLHRCLPGIDKIDQGVALYHSFYSKQDEKKYKVVAIKIKKI